MGLVAAINLKDAKIVSNNGELVTENNSDIKIDYDPTQKSLMNGNCNVTYKQIFYETVRFIDNNNGKDRQYLQYPKLHLKSINVKCNDKKRCMQCCNRIGNDDNNNNNNIAVNPGHFALCSTKTRKIATQLYHSVRERKCTTVSSTATVAKLFLSDESLIKDSNSYKIHSYWFAKVYSFLKWQQEVVNILLHNLVYFDNVSIDKQENEKGKMESVTTKGRVDDGENIFLSKFDLLTSFHSYLHELIEYLLVYYCCFDEQSWIAVFYPFIQTAIGTLECDMIFAESGEHSKQVITSLCNEALTMNEKIKQNVLKEMKAISIFKRLLYNIYNEKEDDNDDAAHTNPFDLIGRICIKLQENSNNIKTQLKIMEMTSNDKTNKTYHNLEGNESNDDCIDDDNNSYSEANKIPCFIRLFVIGRIISTYINSSSSEKEKLSKVEELASICNNHENRDDIESLVFDILSRLVKDGIKKYMNKWYNENEQRDIIRIIFDKIILNKFEKAYYQLIRYGCDEMTQYQTKVFNSSDLMSCIFEYLEYGCYFDGDLFSCSLVDSCWLYHSWNVNGVYHVDLDEIVDITQMFHTNGNSFILRRWQRLIHTKSIKIYAVRLDCHVVWKKLLLLTNIEELEAAFVLYDATEISRFKLLMKRYAPRLKTCNIHASHAWSKFAEDQLLTIKFPNAQKISINNLFVYPIWSNKCQELVFDEKVNVSAKWCNFMIEHCDCSNVKILTLFRKIDPLINKSMLEQLVNKFTSVEKLTIDIYFELNDNILLFWQLLNPILLNNHGKVALDMRLETPSKINLLNETIKKHNLKVEWLNADIGSNIVDDSRDDTIKLVQDRDNDGLNHLKIDIGAEERSRYTWPKTQLYKRLSFRSINVIEFISYRSALSIGFVIELMEMHQINARRMFLIINAQEAITRMVDFTFDDDDDEGKFVSFNRLCRKIYGLIEQKFPVDIRITFAFGEERYFKQCMEIYSSLFHSENVLNEYEEPICDNTVCVPRGKLHTFFQSMEDKECTLVVTNVEYV